MIEQILSYKALFFNIATIVSCTFSPAMSWSLLAVLVEICTCRGDLLSLSPLLKSTIHPPPHCAHVHWVVSINVQQTLMNVSSCHFFPTWRNSLPPLYSICTSMSDTLLSDCPSAAICHIATTWHGNWWEGSTPTAIPPTSVSDTVGQHNKAGGVTLAVAFKNI